MIAKLISAVITIFAITYTVLLIMFFFLHEDIKEAVNDINYSTAEAVSTTGILNDAQYRYLRDSLGRFGSYAVTFKLERQLKEGVYDTFFDSSAEIDNAYRSLDYTEIEVLNKHLQLGDRLTILVEDRNLTVFGRLINSTIFLWSPDRQADTNIRSIKTATIGAKNKNLRTGYDAAGDIRIAAGDASVAVHVVTRTNKAGKYYGSSSHEYVDAENLYYGDDADEKSAGINFIPENGSFMTETEYYPSGEVKLIRYIQQ